jgi:hypothetical protein
MRPLKEEKMKELIGQANSEKHHPELPALFTN